MRGMPSVKVYQGMEGPPPRLLLDYSGIRVLRTYFECTLGDLGETSIPNPNPDHNPNSDPNCRLSLSKHDQEFFFMMLAEALDGSEDSVDRQYPNNPELK